ncbi:MAG: NAD(P)-dependent alcohol dehydrogenase [Thermoanaerobaculia bacterium]
MPAVGDGEVLVRVRSASLHPDVWHVVTGRPYVLRLMGAGLFNPRSPIPGTDMAGVVESVGKGVSRFRPGDAVFGETRGAHQWTHGGAFAEYVSVRQDWLALKPDDVAFEQAASVPTSGFITLLNLRGGSVIRAGARVLVNGAGGGVGALALQIAKAFGAHVTAVDSAGKLDMLRSLWVKPLRLGSSSAPTRQESMAALAELLAAGKITPIIDSIYPLAEIHEAFRHMIEDELSGKVILTAG